jgi:serine/threonine-protein kinase
VAEIARLLDVQHVLEGSVRRAGRRMKARVQLVDASGTVGWSEAFDRTLDDVFAVQEEIAQAVVRALAVELGGTAAPLVRPPTANVEAHDLYLQGRHAMRAGHPAALGRAIARLEQAIARDPAFAAAHASLARAHVLRAVGADVLAGDVVASARAHAERALALDEGLAAAHVARGHVAFALELDLPAAGRAFRRAIALDAGDADATGMLATWLKVNGDYAEAERLARRGVTLDPLVMWSHLLVGRVLLADGRPRDAMPHLRHALALAPTSAYAREYLTHALLLQGHAEEALAEARQTARDGGVRQQLLLVYVLAVTGHPEEARALLERLVASGEPERFPCHVAIALVGLRDHEGALEWLERAFDGPDPHLNGLTTQPPYAPLRSDARFRALVARLLLGAER